ncbi:hypothetical protein IDM30_15485 [Acinetobacter seifertii]|nr:hypothetical protein [Acinetobacter seifertii]
MNDAYVNYLNGEISYVADYYAAGPYEVEGNTDYSVTTAYDQQFAFYDKNMAYILVKKIQVLVNLSRHLLVQST